ncbi:MAG: hypothetical protein KDD52_06520, partial [Bdellovibrionales bacterium]|nr:hypothetical protein [Bdellovibrionales bacterium]
EKKDKASSDQKEKNKNSEKRFPDAPWYSRFAGGYSSNLYQYGTSQGRLDAGLYKTFARGAYAAGLFGGFSFLDIFNTLQIGSEFNARFIDLSFMFIGARSRVYFEHLFGNSKSFWGLGLAVGPMIEFPISELYSVELDPAMMEGMLYRSNDVIPFNLRLTSMISIRRSF